MKINWITALHIISWIMLSASFFILGWKVFLGVILAVWGNQLTQWLSQKNIKSKRSTFL